MQLEANIEEKNVANHKLKYLPQLGKLWVDEVWFKERGRNAGFCFLAWLSIAFLWSWALPCSPSGTEVGSLRVGFSLRVTCLCCCPPAMGGGSLELCRQELPVSKHCRVAFPCGFSCYRGAAWTQPVTPGAGVEPWAVTGLVPPTLWFCP